MGVQSESSVPRYVGLDGVRGFAALVVLLFHASGKTIFPKGYLAVDLFFLLSGFVIANAYERKLQAGGGLGWFFGVRLARLYPIYLAGLLAGALFHAGSGAQTGIALLGGLVGAPFMSGLDRDPYELNGVYWSLAVEMVVGLAYAAWGFGRSIRTLALVAGLALLGKAALTLVPVDQASGGNLVEWISGYLRGVFGFSLGVIVWRLRQSGSLPRVRIAAPLLLAALAVLFAVPRHVHFTEIATLAIGLPVIFLGLLNLGRPAGRIARLCDWSGRLSYPLYAIHMPIMLALFPAFGAKDAGFIVAATLVSLLAAYLMHRTIESQGRALIGRLIPQPA